MAIRQQAAGAVLFTLLVASSTAARSHDVQSSAPQFSLANPESLGFSSDKLKLLDRAMDQAVDDGQVAGILTMLVRHGKIADLHLHGLRSISANAPITRDTIFRIYSQTKPVIGVAMMILFEQGLWRLDDPITKFVPEFSNLKVMSGVDAKGQPILEDVRRSPNMRELVTHTAGFGYGLRSGNPVDDAFHDQRVLASNGLQQMIDKVAHIPLRYQPGTRWSYSVAADIQGYIVQKLTGERLGDFLAEHIFRPLKMKDTGFYTAPGNASRLAAIYVMNPRTEKLLELTTDVFPNLQDFTKLPPMESGGGGLVSTVDDYARFCQMILNGGELDGARILKPETVTMMRTNQIESAVLPDPQYDVAAPIGSEALGFGVDVAVVNDPDKLGTRQGKGSIWWGGAGGTWFWIDPRNDLFFLGMIQRFGESATGSQRLGIGSQKFVYSALTDPEK